MNKNNLVVIIVLNHNKKNDILQCLDSIFKMDYSEFEVIVVDNGSKDGSVEEIKTKYPSGHLVESKTNLGAAGGRNLGMQYVNEKFDFQYILFLDNDSIVEKNALSEMINSFNSKEEIGIVTPKCYMMSKTNTFGYAGGMAVNLFTGKIEDIGSGKKDEGQYDKPMFVDACGGLFLASKNLISRVGMFDDKFNPYGWEDVDYSIRAREKGYNIVYNPKAIVHHKGGKITRTTSATEYEYSKVKNYFYLLKKHANIFQFITLGLFLPLRILKIMVQEILQGKVNVLFYQFKGFFSLFKK